MTKKREYPFFDRMMSSTSATDGQLLIYKFCSQFRLEGKVDPAVMDELATRLEQVLFDGIQGNKALGLGKQRGGQKQITWKEYWHRVEIASAVLLQKQRHPRKTIKRIANELVACYAEKPSFIEDCYEKYKAEAAAALRMLAADSPMDKLKQASWFTDRGHTAIHVSPPKTPRK